MLTKNAVGNLINRYKAVLDNCRLLNVFGTLALAGTVVLGGVGEAQAASEICKIEDKGDTSYYTTYVSEYEIKDGVLQAKTSKGLLLTPQDPRITGEPDSVASVDSFIEGYKTNSGWAFGSSGLLSFIVDGKEYRVGIMINPIKTVDAKFRSDNAIRALTIDNHNTTNVTYDFITNKAPGSNIAGAISIYEEGSVSGTISGDFIGNKASSTGALSTNGGVGTISGNFIGNSSNKEGGALANHSKGSISTISGNFIGNLTKVSGLTPMGGGAIANNGIITTISGDFVSNKSGADEDAGTYIYYESRGGAIHNKGTITNISGDFIGNEVIRPNTNQGGGAIYNKGTITNITGDFIGNKTRNISKDTSSNNGGGAIYNAAGTIVTITGDFYNNEISETGSNSGGGAIKNTSTITNLGTSANAAIFIDNKSDQTGGAVYNTGTINTLYGDFSHNTATSGGAIYNTGAIKSITGNFLGNTATTNGGAIYTTKSLTFAADNTYSPEFTGNKAGSDYNAIYVDTNNVTLTFEMSGSGDFTMNDSIKGKNAYNVKITGGSATNNVFALASNIDENATINVTNATLELGKCERANSVTDLGTFNWDKLTLGEGAALSFNRGNTWILSNVPLTKAKDAILFIKSGIVNVNTATTFSKDVTISGGKLDINNATTFAGAITVSGGTLDTNDGKTTTFGTSSKPITISIGNGGELTADFADLGILFGADFIKNSTYIVSGDGKLSIDAAGIDIQRVQEATTIADIKGSFGISSNNVTVTGYDLVGYYSLNTFVVGVNNTLEESVMAGTLASDKTLKAYNIVTNNQEANFSNASIISTNASLTLTGSNTTKSLVGSGLSIDNQGTLNLGTSGSTYDLTYDGTLTGTGAVNINSAVEFTATNTLAGTTTVNTGGTLKTSANTTATNLTLAGGTLHVASGAFDVSGTGNSLSFTGTSSTLDIDGSLTANLAGFGTVSATEGTNGYFTGKTGVTFTIDNDGTLTLVATSDVEIQKTNKAAIIAEIKGDLGIADSDTDTGTFNVIGWTLTGDWDLGLLTDNVDTVVDEVVNAGTLGDGSEEKTLTAYSVKANGETKESTISNKASMTLTGYDDAADDAKDVKSLLADDLTITVDAGGTLTLGDTDSPNDLTFDGTLTNNGTTNVNSAVDFTGDVTVGGDMTFNHDGEESKITGTLDVGDNKTLTVANGTVDITDAKLSTAGSDDDLVTGTIKITTGTLEAKYDDVDSGKLLGNVAFDASADDAKLVLEGSGNNSSEAYADKIASITIGSDTLTSADSHTTTFGTDDSGKPTNVMSNTLTNGEKSVTVQGFKLGENSLTNFMTDMKDGNGAYDVTNDGNSLGGVITYDDTANAGNTLTTGTTLTADSLVGSAGKAFTIGDDDNDDAGANLTLVGKTDTTLLDTGTLTVTDNSTLTLGTANSGDDLQFSGVLDADAGSTITINKGVTFTDIVDAEANSTISINDSVILNHVGTSDIDGKLSIASGKTLEVTNGTVDLLGATVNGDGVLKVTNGELIVKYDDLDVIGDPLYQKITLGQGANQTAKLTIQQTTPNRTFTSTEYTNLLTGVTGATHTIHSLNFTHASGIIALDGFVLGDNYLGNFIAEADKDSATGFYTVGDITYDSTNTQNTLLAGDKLKAAKLVGVDDKFFTIAGASEGKNAAELTLVGGDGTSLLDAGTLTNNGVLNLTQGNFNGTLSGTGTDSVTNVNGVVAFDNKTTMAGGATLNIGANTSMVGLDVGVSDAVGTTSSLNITTGTLSLTAASNIDGNLKFDGGTLEVNSTVDISDADVTYTSGAITVKDSSTLTANFGQFVTGAITDGSNTNPTYEATELTLTTLAGNITINNNGTLDLVGGGAYVNKEDFAEFLTGDSWKSFVNNAACDINLGSNKAIDVTNDDIYTFGKVSITGLNLVKYYSLNRFLADSTNNSTAEPVISGQLGDGNTTVTLTAPTLVQSDGQNSDISKNATLTLTGAGYTEGDTEKYKDTLVTGGSVYNCGKLNLGTSTSANTLTFTGNLTTGKNSAGTAIAGAQTIAHGPIKITGDVNNFGTTTFEKDASITGAVESSGKIEFEDTASITGTLAVASTGEVLFSNTGKTATITGDVTSSHTLTFAGGADLDSSLTVDAGTTTFGGVTIIDGATNINGTSTANFNGITTINNTFSVVTGASAYFGGDAKKLTTITGAVTSAGTTEFKGAANLGSLAVTGGEITIDGAARITRAVESSALLTFAGDADLDSTLTVTAGETKFTNTTETVTIAGAIQNSAILTFAGGADLDSTLTVTGGETKFTNTAKTATIAGKVESSDTLTFDGGADLDGALTVDAGTTTFGGTTTIDGAVGNSSTLTFNGGATLSDAVESSGALTFAGAADLDSWLKVTDGETKFTDEDETVTIAGKVESSAILTFDGGAELNSTLTVSNGTTTFAGAATIAGAVGNSSTLTFAGGATLSDAVTSSGALTFAGKADLNSTLKVTSGETKFTDEDEMVTIAGVVESSAILTFDGGAELNSTLTVSNGTTTFAGAATIAGAVGNSSTLIFNGGATLSDAVTSSGTLTFDGAADLNSSLSITSGTATFGGVTSIDGFVTSSGTTTFNGAATLGSTLGISGNTTFNNGGSVTGKTTVNSGTLAIGTDTTTADTLSMGGLDVVSGSNLNITSDTLKLTGSTVYNDLTTTATSADSSIKGNLTIATDGTLEIASGLTDMRGATVWDNNGTSKVDGTISVGDSGTLVANFGDFVTGASVDEAKANAAHDDGVTNSTDVLSLRTGLADNVELVASGAKLILDGNTQFINKEDFAEFLNGKGDDSWGEFVTSGTGSASYEIGYGPSETAATDSNTADNTYTFKTGSGTSTITITNVKLTELFSLTHYLANQEGTPTTYNLGDQVISGTLAENVNLTATTLVQSETGGPSDSIVSTIESGASLTLTGGTYDINGNDDTTDAGENLVLVQGGKVINNGTLVLGEGTFNANLETGATTSPDTGTTANGSITIKGTVSSAGTTTFKGDATLEKTLTIADGGEVLFTDANKKATITGAVESSGTLTFNGEADLDSTLTVNGAAGKLTNFIGTTTVDGLTNITGGTTNFNGETTIGTLLASGGTYSEVLTVGENGTVAFGGTSKNTATIYGAVTSDGETSFSGEAILKDKLTVEDDGNVSFKATDKKATITGAVTSDGTLTFSGDADLDSTLTVNDGKTSFDGITVIGDAAATPVTTNPVLIVGENGEVVFGDDVNDTTTIYGAVTSDGALSFSGAADIKDTLTVNKGTTTFNDTTIIGTAPASGTTSKDVLTVTGGTATLGGVTTINGKTKVTTDANATVGTKLVVDAGETSGTLNTVTMKDEVSVDAGSTFDVTSGKVELTQKSTFDGTLAMTDGAAMEAQGINVTIAKITAKDDTNTPVNTVAPYIYAKDTTNAVAKTGSASTITFAKDFNTVTDANSKTTCNLDASLYADGMSDIIFGTLPTKPDDTAIGDSATDEEKAALETYTQFAYIQTELYENNPDNADVLKTLTTEEDILDAAKTAFTGYNMLYVGLEAPLKLGNGANLVVGGKPNDSTIGTGSYFGKDSILIADVADINIVPEDNAPVNPANPPVKAPDAEAVIEGGGSALTVDANSTLALINAEDHEYVILDNFGKLTSTEKNEEEKFVPWNEDSIIVGNYLFVVDSVSGTGETNDPYKVKVRRNIPDAVKNSDAAKLVADMVDSGTFKKKSDDPVIQFLYNSSVKNADNPDQFLKDASSLTDVSATSGGNMNGMVSVRGAAETLVSRATIVDMSSVTKGGGTAVVKDEYGNVTAEYENVVQLAAGGDSISDAPAALGGTNAGPDLSNSVGLWAMPFYAHESLSGAQAGMYKNNTSTDMYGMTMGIDKTFTPTASTGIDVCRAGLAFNVGTGKTEAHGDTGDSQSDFDFFGLAAYGSMRVDALTINGSASYTQTKGEFSNGLVSGETTGDVWYGVLNAEYAFDMSMLGGSFFKNFKLVPYAGLGFMTADTRDYTTNINTKVSVDRQNVFSVPFGLKFNKEFTLDSGWVLKPEVNAGLVYADGDLDQRTETSNPFGSGVDAIDAQVVEQMTMDLGFGVDIRKDEFGLFLDYSLQKSNIRTAHGVSAKFEYRF